MQGMGKARPAKPVLHCDGELSCGRWRRGRVLTPDLMSALKPARVGGVQIDDHMRTKSVRSWE